jgi:hypothetical protein
VSHTHLDKVKLKNAQRNVLMDLTSNYTQQRTLRHTKQFLMLNSISSQTVQLKPVSSFTKTSWPTNQVSTDTFQDNNSEDMPSKLLDGVLKKVLNIGLLLTLGEPNGVTTVSSKSKKDNANSKVN